MTKRAALVRASVHTAAQAVRVHCITVWRAAAALHTVHTFVRSLEPRGHSVFQTNLLSRRIGHTVLLSERIEFLNPKLFAHYLVLSGRYYSAFWCSAIFRLIIAVEKSRIKLAVASASSALESGNACYRTRGVTHLPSGLSRAVSLLESRV